MKTSVIITTYRRFDELDTIIRAWLVEPVLEVWVLDGSGKFRSGISDKRFLLFSMPKDFGTKMDYAMGLLAEGDMIILADDDVLPKPGLVEDLHRGMEKTGADIVGIHGRRFHGPDYRKDTNCFIANIIEEPIQVGFCGVLFMLSRNLLGFDIRGMETSWDDFWLCMKAWPGKIKYVIPTKNWSNLPAAFDSQSHFHDKNIRKIREQFYTKWYKQNYAPSRRVY